MATATGIDELVAWRAQMDASLRADDGWLALAGLFWLEEGDNTVGSGPGNDLVFPEGTCPVRLGTFHRSGDVVALSVAEGVTVAVNGEAVSGTTSLRHDDGGPGTPDLVSHGSLAFHVLVRGPRVGIRLRDRDSAVRAAFTGRTWFEPNPAAAVTARFERFPAGTTIPITNVLGDTEDNPSPGRVHFTYDGTACSMDAVASGDNLFFIFRDRTSGASTYGAGRFLHVPVPDGDTVTLDFNRAVSPPCAFTVHATCPLPPAQNHLPVAVEAGERHEGSHH